MGNNSEIKEEDKENKQSVISFGDAEMYQSANILWLDAQINNPENKKYQEKIKKINQIKFLPFTETKDCIDTLKSIRYEKTFIIVSGSLLNEFYQELQKLMDQLEVVPEILVFTSQKRIISTKEKIIEGNNSLFNVNSVYNFFDPVKNRLKRENLYNSEHKITSIFENDETFTFEYIKESKDLILPLYFTDYIDCPAKNEIIDFNKFLLDKYSKDKKLEDLIQQLIVSYITIPIQILIKYYLRAYTIESSFYKEMNYLLERKNGDNYETYIKVLYHSLLLKYIKPATEEKLYRGTRIKKSELEYIKKSFENKKENLPACICYNKSFLSSSYKEDVAFKFMIKKEKKNNEEYVIYEFEKGTELDNQNASNSNIEKFSSFEEAEAEILFFPFSSFELTKLPEERIYSKDNKTYSYYRIYLNYLGKYKKIIDNNGKIPENNFTKIILKTEILEKFKMENNSNQFDFDIKQYIPQEKRKNYIIATYKINETDVNKDINILNCDKSNKEEIMKSCNIYLKDKKINFDFVYKFDKPGTYTFMYEFSDLLTNANKLFYGCKTLISLDFTKFKTNYITDMTDMFNGCSLLKSLDLSNFKTHNVTTMEKMFYDCKSLENLDVSSFNTIKVTKMDYMFGNCIGISFLNLSNFETKGVLSMQGMFDNCNSLIGLNISNFKTEELFNMSEMFNCCSSLKSLDLSKFYTYNVIQMNKLFYKCSSLTSLNISNFKTNNVTTMEKMFTECSSLTSLDLSNFETTEIINTVEMFKKCSSLNYLNLNKFDCTKLKKEDNMFMECDSLNDLILGPKSTFLKETLNELNKNCKINFDGNIYDIDNIKTVNLDDTMDAIFGKKDDLKSSVRSNYTIDMLIKNNLIGE